jgi:hypothetical protein
MRWESRTFFRVFWTLAWKEYLQMHVLASCFAGDDWGLLKEGVKTYLMAPMSHLNSPIFFGLHIYSPICKDPLEGVLSRILSRWSFQGSPLKRILSYEVYPLNNIQCDLQDCISQYILIGNKIEEIKYYTRTLHSTKIRRRWTTFDACLL